MNTVTITVDQDEVFSQVICRSGYIGFKQCGGLNGLKEKSASERDARLLHGYWKELYAGFISILAAEVTVIDSSPDITRLQFEILTEAGTQTAVSAQATSATQHPNKNTDSSTLSTVASAWFSASLLYLWLRTVGFPGYTIFKEDTDSALETLRIHLRTLTTPRAGNESVSYRSITRRLEPI